jgi:hypothetical protein
MRASMGAMKAALPSIMKGLNDAREAMDKALANMPSPTYPAR